MEISLLILLILILLSFSAFFSGSETAIISANKIRLKSLAERGDSRAKILNWFLEKPERLLGTILVGNNLVNVACTTLAAVLINLLFQYTPNIEYDEWESLITTLIMTPIILIFGEIIPKSMGRYRSNSMSLSVARSMRFISIILYLVVAPLNKFISLFGKKNIQNPDRIMEELKGLANLSQHEGLIKPEQSEMIHSVFDLREQTIERAMVPLVDMVSVSRYASLDDFYEVVSETRFSRFPIYEDRNDNIVGIINVSDVLFSDNKIQDIGQFIREDVVFLPESKHIISSLTELQQSPYPMGIVVDEYGGVAGLVTLEDIVAEIVGEIKDERNQEEEAGIIFDGKDLECDGRTEVDVINDYLNTNIPDDEYETVAGFVISQMDKIPIEGEEFTWQNLRIKILKADKRSVLKVKFIVEEEGDNEEAETWNTER